MMKYYNENTRTEDTEQLLNVEKLLGFKQIADVCKTGRNFDLPENVGRLLNKIGETPPTA